MSLLNVYSIYKEGLISHDEAAAQLNLTPESLKIRMERWGDRMPTLLAALDAIANDEATRPEVASVLGISLREVNHLMESWGIKRPIKPYLISRTASKVKWELRKKHAIDYIAGADLETCALNAQCSDRQIRRWVSELLDKHFGMMFKDLRELTIQRRRRLADEIEEAEGLELAAQNVLNSITSGEKTLAEEALERLKAKHRNKK